MTGGAGVPEGAIAPVSKAGESRSIGGESCLIRLRKPGVLNAAEAWQSGRLHLT